MSAAQRSPPESSITGGTIVARTHRNTPADDPSRIRELIADAVRELTSEYTAEGIGVGAAGFVDEQRSTVMFAPNLAWRDEQLRTSLEQHLRLPVVIENDANAAAWAEVRFGAGRGEPHVVILTVGTGIGASSWTGSCCGAGSCDLRCAIPP
ncbi:MAG: ROK family protein [Pseudonocardiaceae bacterium]